ncbi:MAG: hypothetical protein QXS37_05320 [Candidatus Aenigmatarchaeota archaeon]
MIFQFKLFLKRLALSLNSKRNYEKIRPYSKYCEETIMLEE